MPKIPMISQAAVCRSLGVIPSPSGFRIGSILYNTLPEALDALGLELQAARRAAPAVQAAAAPTTYEPGEPHYRLGELVAQARQSRNLSQDDLARLIGCSHTVINRLESSDSAGSEAFFRKLSVALQLDLPMLLEERRQFLYRRWQIASKNRWRPCRYLPQPPAK